jgi:hypothetical protein
VGVVRGVGVGDGVAEWVGVADDPATGEPAAAAVAWPVATGVVVAPPQAATTSISTESRAGRDRAATVARVAVLMWIPSKLVPFGGSGADADSGEGPIVSSIGGNGTGGCFGSRNLVHPGRVSRRFVHEVLPTANTTCILEMSS